MRSTAEPVVGRSPRGRLHVGTSRAPLALFEPAFISGAGAVRVLLGVRAPLSLDPDRVPPPDADDPLDDPPDEPPDEPPPRVTALPPPLPPLGPEERGAAPCPSSLYDMPLLKPARCCGANSRTARSPKLMDGEDAAPADGELEVLELPLLLTDPPSPDPADETAPPPPPPPRSTAPPELAAPPPVDRSAAPACAPPLSDGFCAKAGAARVSASTTPRPRLKGFIRPDCATDLPHMGPLK